MTPREVLNNLSEIEEFFFYARTNHIYDQHRDEMTELHTQARAMLEKWHEITGLTLD